MRDWKRKQKQRRRKLLKVFTNWRQGWHLAWTQKTQCHGSNMRQTWQKLRWSHCQSTKETSNAHTREPTKLVSNIDFNVLKCVGTQGVPENSQKSEPLNLAPRTDLVKGILRRLGVTSHKTELRRLGKVYSDRKEPRKVMLNLSTERKTRLVLAKNFETGHDLTDKSIFVLQALSKEGSRKENLCLKKWRQILEQKVGNTKPYNNRV